MVTTIFRVHLGSALGYAVYAVNSIDTGDL